MFYSLEKKNKKNQFIIYRLKRIINNAFVNEKEVSIVDLMRDAKEKKNFSNEHRRI
jgi:hypothetical protein